MQNWHVLLLHSWQWILTQFLCLRERYNSKTVLYNRPLTNKHNVREQSFVGPNKRRPYLVIYLTYSLLIGNLRLTSPNKKPCAFFSGYYPIFQILLKSSHRLQNAIRHIKERSVFILNTISVFASVSSPLFSRHSLGALQIILYIKCIISDLK